MESRWCVGRRQAAPLFGLTLVFSSLVASAQGEPFTYTSYQLSNSTTAVTSRNSSESSNVSNSGVVSWIVAGSAGLLLTTAGGIASTIFAVDDARKARLRAETLRQAPASPATPPPPPPAQEGAPPTPSAPPPPPPSTSAPPRAGPSFAAMLEARAWLLANRLQLMQDLALGAGPAIDELAALAGIAPARRAHFGRALQRLRSRLVVAPDVTPVAASQVMSEVGELILTDPLLRPDAELRLASW